MHDRPIIILSGRYPTKHFRALESSNTVVHIGCVEFPGSGLVPKEALRGGWRSQLAQLSEEPGWVDGSFVSILAKLCDHMLALCAT